MQMTCENCGAALDIQNQFIRNVTCSFCGSNYVVTGGSSLEKQGVSAKLGDYPSRLHVGARGKIKGRGFSVLGRVRYTYDDGFWEEWQIAWEDGETPSWLEEDEGMWTVYRRGRVKSEIPPFENVKVGASIEINQTKVFITEKRTGKLQGSDGQFSSVLPLTDPFGYVTGPASDKTISINYWPDEIEVSLGEEVEDSDMVIEG